VDVHPGSRHDEPPGASHLTAAISNALVRIQHAYLGRGPSRVRTLIREDTVLVLMQDTLTRAERSLVAAGKDDEVLRVRDSLQRTMRSEIVAAVEALTGRPVLAFMSANHIDPDLACEVIVLQPREA
jgi:uncharacterized protein YbcI